MAPEGSDGRRSVDTGPPAGAGCTSELMRLAPPVVI